ncbi:unnamed protein product [Vitrella brassicaformis CCMP3155]|uniref:Uncharacterized protein n=1 Tax=Vitrella brassicaformis (strain CCMP3155) TaxID=1169540 RepID=A0A0G4EBA7_VITBC|nr:unnamed protein product [Vitrella brassicaformis CCMP3155]|eukprot:CEL93240.1 unnamed protein product [Vitrella brassicaformis CCMP3155]
MADETQNVRNLVLSVCDLRQHGDIPTARVASQIVTVGTRLYLHGGADEKAAYGDLHVMEIEKASWKELNVGGFSKPTPRYGHSLQAHPDTQSLVLFGGLAEEDSEIMLDEQLQKSFPPPPFMAPTAGSASTRLRPWAHQGSPSSDLFLLQTSTLVWTQPEITGPMPPARAFHSASVFKNQLVVFGGATDANLTQASNELWILDLGKSAWQQPSQTGEVPSARYGHKTVCFQDKLLLFGGAEDDGALFSLDLATQGEYVWSRVEVANTAPLSRSFHSMDLIGDRVFIFAGQTIAEVSDLYIYDSAKSKWSRPLYEGQINVKSHCSTVLHDKLIVFGDDGGGPGQRISRKLFFLNVLQIRDGAGDGDFKFKLVTVGDSGVGKSCLLTRFVQDVYSDFHVSTIGVDFKTVVTMIKGKLVKLQLWDTAGQERFSVVTGNYYRNADGFVLVYDATSRESFDHVDQWLNQIQEHHDCGPSTVKLLVGNKYDLKDQIQVSEEEAKACADRIGAIFVNTSAKTASNVDNAFLSAAAKLVDLRRKNAVQTKSLQLSGGGAGASESDSTGRGRVNLSDAARGPRKTGCCAQGGGSSAASSSGEREGLTQS